MLTGTIFLLVAISSAFGAIAIQEAKIGERVELDLGEGVVNWMRKTDNGEEFIKYCGPTEKGPRCAQFVKADNTPAKSPSSAHVTVDGKLIIDSFKASDAGLYSSLDQKPIEHKHPDGSTSSTLGVHIQLVAKD
ncbi:hypothetical protein GCK32_005638 [Trichostrongylus colubriformis]|uniref:Uncharacterized protein n=1 Tax=Trichostrongylus colubriformis TaxID=6319 RepID=A0AAN8IIH4_TRICO